MSRPLLFKAERPRTHLDIPPTAGLQPIPLNRRCFSGGSMSDRMQTEMAVKGDHPKQRNLLDAEVSVIITPCGLPNNTRSEDLGCRGFPSPSMRRGVGQIIGERSVGPDLANNPLSNYQALHWNQAELGPGSLGMSQRKLLKSRLARLMGRILNVPF